MAEVGLQYDWTSESMTDLSTRTANGQRAFDQLTGEMALGAEQAEALSESLRNTARNTEGATSAVDEFGDTVTTLPDGTTIYIDAETGKATTDVNLIEKRIYGIPDGSSTVNVAIDAAERVVDAFVNKKRAIRVAVDAVTTLRTAFGSGVN